MEVDQGHFKQRLLPILKHIAKASFVSFDLEMSGIHRNYRFGPKAGGHDNGKPSLQQLYEETRAAAETYQVLQVGITIVEEDREKEFYLARPFNFNLSPLFFLDNKSKDRFPERQIVFSSSATDFLQGEGFNVGKVFAEGVYYLSHAEEEETRERFRTRSQNENTKADVNIPPGDTKALEFFRNARKTISAWINAEKPEHNFVNIGNPDGDLNGYQRLLVHQLVKNEFPGYRSFPRGNQSFIQIEKVDPKKEASFAARKLTEFNNTIAKQIGLRWIFEAVTGGDLSGIPTSWFSDESGSKPELAQNVVDKEFAEVMDALKNKKHVIVGHNLFTDLVYLYTTFIGPLPKSVEDFQDRIGYLFPIVIDTKYLATEGHDSMSTVMRKSLSELLEPLKKVHTPLILLHEEHASYGASVGKKHEAGYDSWMTAELFVKLASKIYLDRKRTEDFDDSNSDSSLTYTTVMENATSPQSSSSDDESKNGGTKLVSQYSEDDLLDLQAHTSNGDHSMSLIDNQTPLWHAAQMQKLNLNDKNPFSVLEEVGESVDTGKEYEPKRGQWIPRMESSFWHLYANKLRVNASDAGVCDLNSYMMNDRAG